MSCGNTLDGKLFVWNMGNGHIVCSVALIPTTFSEAPLCLTWGGYAKDYKGRATTDYQFSVGGAKKLTMWHLNPVTGEAAPELVNTGTMVRNYTCMAYSKTNEEYLFAGTASGDFCGFLVKSKVLVFTINACALGIKTIRALAADRVVVGGGDG